MTDPASTEKVERFVAIRKLWVDLQDVAWRSHVRRWLTWVLLSALFAQLLAIHVAFWWYRHDVGWDGVEPSVMVAYFGATVGNTVGLVLIVVRHVFNEPHDT